MVPLVAGKNFLAEWAAMAHFLCAALGGVMARERAAGGEEPLVDLLLEHMMARAATNRFVCAEVAMAVTHSLIQTAYPTALAAALNTLRNFGTTPPPSKSPDPSPSAALGLGAASFGDALDVDRATFVEEVVILFRKVVEQLAAADAPPPRCG